MRYWWVNQGSTFKQEVRGDYMWSPQRNNNGSFSQYYANMTLVEPGDVVLSYASSRIRAVGVALSAAHEAPKPLEFGAAGMLWADLGWRVDVEFHELRSDHVLNPKDHLEELLPLRPKKYSPIRENGDSFTAYLFEMPPAFAHVLLSKIESLAEWHLAQLLQQNELDLRRIGEDRVEAFLKSAPIDETQRKALIAARRGQGWFRQAVSRVEPACRFTGVTTPELLTASHIQPWHRCHTNAERLDPFNGLMLTPTYDRLFDRGLISFSQDHRLIISKHLQRADIELIRMDPDVHIAPFRVQQLKFLAYHRDQVFRAA